jgi:hypothetical protein
VAVIVKCDPPVVSPDGVCIVEERMYYRAQPESGEAIYLWEAETAGGRGLTMRGKSNTYTSSETAPNCGSASIRITRRGRSP